MLQQFNEKNRDLLINIWAKHWYGEVATSTSFRKPSNKDREEVPARLSAIYEKARKAYELLHRHRLH